MFSVVGISFAENISTENGLNTGTNTEAKAVIIHVNKNGELSYLGESKDFNIHSLMVI